MKDKITTSCAPFDVAPFDSDAFTRHLAKIAPNLTPPQVVVVKCCASTQDVARKQCDEGAAHATVVATDHQENGRGRAGRGWTHLRGALAMSIVLRPQAQVAKWVRLTSLTGLALVDTIAALGAKAQLKWPNDVVIEPTSVEDHPHISPPLGRFRKVGGLLVDGVTRGANLEAAIVGIGLNTAPAEIPEELHGIAATLASIDVDVSRELFLAHFHACLHSRLSALDDEDKMRSSHEDLLRASFTLGREVVDADGNRGTAVSLDPEGALIIEDSRGSKRLVWAGDVRLA